MVIPACSSARIWRRSAMACALRRLAICFSTSSAGEGRLEVEARVVLEGLRGVSAILDGLCGVVATLDTPAAGVSEGPAIVVAVLLDGPATGIGRTSPGPKGISSTAWPDSSGVAAATVIPTVVVVVDARISGATDLADGPGAASDSLGRFLGTTPVGPVEVEPCSAILVLI